MVHCPQSPQSRLGRRLQHNLKVRQQSVLTDFDSSHLMHLSMQLLCKKTIELILALDLLCRSSEQHAACKGKSACFP